MLVYHCDELLSLRYTDLDFQSDRDSCKSTFDFVFTLSGGSVSWKSVKESCITNSAMEVEYVATFEVAKKAIWLQKFLLGLGVVHLAISPLVLFCDNNGVVTQFKELRNHQNSKHIKKKVSLDTKASIEKRCGYGVDLFCREPNGSLHEDFVY